MDAWPSAKSINGYWLEHRDDLPAGTKKPVDLNEPECFACGWYNSAGDADLKPFRGLERAHVVPRAKGGSMHPRNFALLCSECHRAAPDTTDGAWFWSWVADRPSNNPWQRFVARAQEINRLVDSSLTDRERSVFTSVRSSDHGRVAKEAIRRVQPVSHFGAGVSAATVARVIIEATRLLADENEPREVA